MMRGNLLVLGFAGLASVAAVHAQGADPTRPAGIVSGPATDAGAGASTPAETGVQTVIIRPGGKSSAVINGQHVVAGGKFGEKRVLKISETEIVLKGENGRETIKVTPSIEKTPARKTAARTQRTTGTDRQ